MKHFTIGTNGQGGGAYPFVDKTDENTWMKDRPALPPALPMGASMYINFSYGQDLYDWVSGSATNKVKKMNSGVWVDEHKGWKTAIYPSVYTSQDMQCIGMLRYDNKSVIVDNDVLRLAEIGDPSSHPGQTSDAYSVALDVECFSGTPDDGGYTWQFVVKELGAEVERSGKVSMNGNKRFVVSIGKSDTSYIFMVMFAMNETDTIADIMQYGYQGWGWSWQNPFPSSFNYPRWVMNGYTTGGSITGSYVTHTNGDFVVQEFGMFG